jgi:hypothetical protein
MKYTNYFRGMMIVSLFFIGCAVEAYLETMPTACALFSVCAFSFWFGGIMAPDSEKYTPQYLKKYKGWS